MRPRKHSLHPSDLMLLFNMAASRGFLTGEHWTPVCLPRFNDQGFLHVYVNYITPNAALLLVSADRDSFPTMSECCGNIVEDLSSDGSLQRLDDAAAQRALHPSELGVRRLLHMHYKHKTLVQNFGSCFDDSVPEDDRLRILSTYKRLRLHMVGNMSQPLRIIYRRTATDTVLAWQSTKFELYATVAPTMDVRAMIRMVNNVLEWIRSEEDHLFIINSPSY
ncbi:Vacuolar fusion protein MON1 A [Linderina macrospora]|uniref:Vacuolar fusion protein MON1 A n=1 Tax=Linderina macrospora TaxID=4868 RepID=A0ACC1J5H8_9FUNG|nr:Vacuolar fusion protein MON1 A [Linderina macrospora]